MMWPRYRRIKLVRRPITQDSAFLKHMRKFSMNGGSGGAPQILADQERAAAALACCLITRPPDFEIFRHP